MSIKVLIVDDSSFFRNRLKEIISGDPMLEVAGEAADGKEGVDKTISLRPDVVTMDVEMPVMDGVTAVKEIMSKCPTPVLMFSSLTYEGADSTLKALDAGAVDFMPKNFSDIAHRREEAINNLRSLIKAVARSRIRGRIGGLARPASAASRPASRPTAGLSAASALPKIHASTISTAPGPIVSSATRSQYDRINDMLTHDQGMPAAAMKFSFGTHKSETTAYRRSGVRHSLVAIGSSTGGPIALQNIIPKLPKLPVPVVVVQHMPGSFTKTFAQRLDGMSQLHVVEAKDGDILQAGTCYIAPGGMQMIFERAGTSARVRILKDNGRVSYNPCVDVSFASLCQIYGGRILAMILTGMGSDGCEGCRLMKQKGAVIWAQNEDTCVVYGMPQAIVNAGIADLVLPLDEIAEDITKEF
ncbi:MAG: chemotaxis response regulator protein-glutamate methylesterase [Succinivibrio sp.]